MTSNFSRKGVSERVTKVGENMNSGYVYILMNDSMPGIIKIGKTTRAVRQRARELSGTSVPTPYKVVFEIFVNDADGLEKLIHETLIDYRINPNREFFRYPINEAISLILNKVSSKVRNAEEYVAVEVLEALTEEFPNCIKSDFKSIRIVQSEERVWLETTIEEEIGDYLKDQTIHRMDLGFIVDYVDRETDAMTFDVRKNVLENADYFAYEFGSYAIVMTTDLFTKEAERRICKAHSSAK